MDNHTHLLSVQEICASYLHKEVLRHVSLSVHSGEVLCLSGPNGSGKSTLLSILAGIIPDGLRIASASQRAFFDKMPLKEMPRGQIARHIAYMPQVEQCSWNYTVREIVLSGRYAASRYRYGEQDYKVVDGILDSLCLAALADRTVYTLSGGEWQKVRIARALAQEADILLLDEPVANLDFTYQNDLLTIIREYAHTKQVGVILSIHDLNTAALFADTLALLAPLGSCLCGTVSEVLTTAQVQAVYGASCSVFTHPIYGCPQLYYNCNKIDIANGADPRLEAVKPPEPFSL